MNNAKLETEFLENPNPSRTGLRRIAKDNGMDLSEVERWFELKRLSLVDVEDPEIQVQDLVLDHNVPGPSAGRRRVHEESEHQEQDQIPVKRPAVVDPAIQKTNEKLDLYLRNPRSQEFLLGVMKIIGTKTSEEETNHTGIIGVDANVICERLIHVPLPPVQPQPPAINRNQLPDPQPQIHFEGMNGGQEEEEEEEEEDEELHFGYHNQAEMDLLRYHEV